MLGRPADEVEQAAADAAHGRNGELVLADGPGERLGQHTGGMPRSAGSILDPQPQGRHRQPVQELERIREALILQIEDEIDAALPEQLDVLRAVPVRAPEAQGAQHLAKRGRMVPVVHEFDELDAADPRRPGLRGSELVLEPEEGAHAVGRDLLGGAGAELVAEDFVADRASISGAHDLAHHVDHREVALAGKATVVAAQEQEVHLDPGRIRRLHQHDLLGRDFGDRVQRALAGERVERVQDQPDMWVIRPLHRLPGLAVIADVATPAQCLEAHGDAVRLGELAQFVQVGRDPSHVVDRVGRDAAADQQQVRAQPVHQLELAPGAVEGAGAQGLGQTLEVAERLQGQNLEAERGRYGTHVLRAAVEVGEVVLEDLDAVIARLGGGGELVRQRARHADGGDASLHAQLPRSRAAGSAIDQERDLATVEHVDGVAAEQEAGAARAGPATHTDTVAETTRHPAASPEPSVGSKR